MVRILLVVLAISALLRANVRDAVALSLVLIAHLVGHYAISRLGAGSAAGGTRSRLARTWAATLLDLVLAGSAFYFTGGADGPSSILGIVWAAVVAGRVGLWAALAANLVLWLLFTAPLIDNWLQVQNSFVPILGSFFSYLVITLAMHYLVSLEARQGKPGGDAAQRLQRLADLRELGQTTSAILELDDLLPQVTEGAAKLLKARTGLLLLVEGPGGAEHGSPGNGGSRGSEPRTGGRAEVAVVRAVYGPGADPLLGQSLAPGEGLAGSVLAMGESHVVDEIRSDARWAEAPDLAFDLEVCSALAVPLVSDGRMIGVLEVTRAYRDIPFDGQDLELLAAFGGQVAVALRNAHLYGEAQRRLRLVDTFYEVSRSLASLDSRQVLAAVARQTAAALAVDLCGVFLRSTDRAGREWAVLRALHDLEGGAAHLLGTRFDLAEHVTLRTLLRESGYAVFHSIGSDERLDEGARAQLEALGIRSCLFVGMYLHERAEGFILAAQRSARRSFSADEIELCQALARHAVVAVENARQYESTDEALSRRLQELAAIEEIDHELGSRLDYEHIIDLVLQRAVQACQASSGVVGILADGGRRLETHYWRVEEGTGPTLTSGEWPVESGIIGRVVRGGEPLLVDDVRQEPDYQRVNPDTRSELAVPIKRDERVIGVLNLESDRLAAFGQQDLRFVEHLAEHAGIAIENARLFREERRRVQMLSAIGEISREMRVSLDLEPTLNLILARIRDLVDYYIAEICLWDEERHLLVTRASAGDPRYTAGTGGIYRLHEGFSGWIARNRETLLLPDIATRTDVRPKIGAEDAPIRSYVGLPLKAGATFVGTLELASDQVGAYGEGHLEILSILADQAAVAIQGARLYAETQRRFEQTQLLLRVGETIRSGVDLTETVRLVAREVCRALDADMAGVYLPDEEQKYLNAVAGYQVPRDKLDHYRRLAIPLEGQPFVEEAWATRRAVYSLDPEHDPRIDERIVEAFPYKAALFAPMVARGELVGGVYLVWKKEKTEFDEEDLELANAIAWQAGAVVESSRLLEAQQRRVRELGILFETSAAVSSSLALDEVLRTVAVQMARALDVASCSISDWDPGRGLITTLAAEPADPSLAASAVAGGVGQSYSAADHLTILEALRERQPKVIQAGDSGANAAERALLQRFGQESLLMIPLVAHDQVMGMVELYEYRQVRDFTEDDVRLGSALANQAAIAIENARLYERTDERLQARIDELTAMERITAELSATLELDRILRIVLESAIETTGASHGNVMLVDMASSSWAEDPQLALRIAQGYSDEERTAINAVLLAPAEGLEDESLVRQVARDGQARIVHDAWQETCTVCVKPSTRSALIVPIFYEEMVVGLINVRQGPPEAFDQRDLSFVQALAQQAAVALGNAMRFEEQVRVNTSLRDRTEQMTRLLEVSRKTRTDVPLEETLEEIAYAIQETVGFNLVLISIKEGVQPVLRRVAAAGLSLRQFEEMAKIRQPAARYEALFREEYQLGPTYFFPWQERGAWETDLHTATPMPEVDEWQEGQWHPHDMLLVPLRGAGGRIVGHISVDEPRDGQRPSQRTIEVLAIFANQAAIAVENASLYADARRRADNLALINDVGRTLSHVLEPESVVNTVARAVTDLLDCDLSTIFQIDPRDGKLVAVASRGVDLAELANLRFAPGEGPVGQVAETRRPLSIPDTQGKLPFDDSTGPLGSMLLAPILAGKQLLGVVTAGRPDAHGLSEADQVLLTTLADQAAVSLENARLFASTQQAAVRLSLLNEIGRRAAAQLEFQEMLETTVEALHRNLGYYRLAVLLLNKAGTELRVAAANEGFWSVIPADLRLQVGEGLIGLAASSGEPVLVHDTEADARYVAVDDWQCLSSLSVAIKLADEVIGVLHAEAEHRMVFTEEDVASLSIAADQFAVAIQNARLFQETQRRVAELATITEIGRAISSALDASELYELIYDQVSKLLETRNFHIALYDPEAELIHVEFLVERGEVQSPVTLSLGQGLTSYLVRRGESILLTHGTEEFLAEHGLSLEREPARSWLGVPMIAEDRVIGAMAVQSFDQDDAFDAGHLELLRTIAGQAAVAFQNARLFEERDRRIGELAVLNEIAQTVSSTLELDALLELVYNQISRLMDTTNFSIALYDQGADAITFPFVVNAVGRQVGSPPEGGSDLTRHVVETAQPLLLRQGGAVLAGEPDGALDLGPWACWLGVPMVAEDRVLGVISVESYTRADLYSQDDRTFLMTVASQSAVAVRNAQLYEQIVRFSSELEGMVEERTRDLARAAEELTVERDRAEALYRIASELGSSLELERVLQRTLQLFADALAIEHGTILLVDPETEQMSLRATLEQGRDLPREGKPVRWKRGMGLAGWVLEEREAILIPDITRDERWIQRPDKPVHVRSVVAAPLSLGGGDILGILTLGHPRVGYFTPEHMQLVTAATAQIAIALNNSDLYAFITDQAEQLGAALQTQQEEAAKSRAILESIADGVLVLDHNGRVLLVNPAAEELLGFSAIALEGQHIRHMLGLGETLVHRELAQALYTELRKRLEEGARVAIPAGASIRLVAENTVLAANVAPLIVSLGAAPGVVAALRDISREAEVERLKNEFISTVSHELRTPMTSIKGYTDLLFLGMAGGLTDTQRSFLQIIKSNADRLTALVNDILDISRIETGRLRLTIESLDLVELINGVVSSFWEQYREKGLELAWEAPAELSEVRGDATRVSQVLSNLVANAWHYTPEGGQVTIAARPVDGHVQVDIADTGIGIAAEDLDRIFDRFFRVDHPVVQEAGGSGLGLSIVKMFVEMLGGRIWVDSEVDVGSTFHFTLPLHTTESPEPSADLLTSEPTAVVSRRPKILVVEDARDLALQLRRKLEVDGYQVLLAGSGEDALWLAKEEQPQLIVLDVMLPDMDGFVVLERLKSHPVTAPIPVIVTSVLVEAERGYSLGAIDYVVKPLVEDKLLGSVRRAASSLWRVQGQAEAYQAKLLVVDGDADSRSQTEESLSASGFEVFLAASGKDALDQLSRCQPDLILLDLETLDMDGYETIRWLKAQEDGSDVPIIIVTSSPVDREREKVTVLGMDAIPYVTKPLSLEALIDEIRRAIAERMPG
jgi:PAS domain S-box-containing protein